MDYCIRPCIKGEVEEKIHVRQGGKYPRNRLGLSAGLVLLAVWCWQMVGFMFF